MGTSFNVVTYNTHLLPALARPFAGTRGRTRYRAQQIGKLLADKDIVGLCEVFDASCRKSLVQAIESDSNRHCLFRPARSGRALIGGGLLLTSRFPMLETHSCVFTDATRVIKSGLRADGLAAKGVLHARLDLAGGYRVDCFLTHLESQASGPRARQIEQLGRFISKHRCTSLPAIVLGDFNIAGPRSEREDVTGLSYVEYARLIDAISSAGQSVTDVGLSESLPGMGRGTADALAKDGGPRIDYMFLLQPQQLDAPQVVCHSVETNDFRDASVPQGSLSDHRGIDSVLAISERA